MSSGSVSMHSSAQEEIDTQYFGKWRQNHGEKT